MHYSHARSKSNIVRTTCLCGVSLLTLALMGNSSVLAQDTTKLKTVKVTTATKTKVDLRDAPASVTVITSEELEQRPVKDILEAIRQTPSIRLEGRGVGGRKVLTIRGMESHQSLTMIDGKRISMSDNVFGHSDFQFNWIPMDAVERIEIVRGPLSALYGSEALGGVINIITKAVPDEWGGSLRGGYGFAGEEGGSELNLGGFVSGPIAEKIGVMMSVNYTDLSKRELKEDKRYSEQEGKEILSLFGRLSFTPAQGHRIDFDAAVVDEERARDAKSRGRAGIFHESFYDLDRSQFGLSYKGDFDGFNLELKGYRSRIAQKNRTTKNVAVTRPQTIIEKTVDGHVTFGLGEVNMITAGAEYRSEGLIHAAIATGEQTINHTALFIQDELSFSEEFFVTAGLRYDHHGMFGSELSPRIYGVFHASDKITLKAGYGHGFKAPTIKQISKDYKFIGFHSFYGNPDVGPESSNNFEISAAYTDDVFSAKITGFHNKIKDLIVSKCIINCRMRFGKVYSYFNVNEATTQGIETEFEVKFTDGFGANFNYVYLKSEDTRTGLELGNRPKNTFNAKVNYHSADMGLSASLRYEHTGTQMIYDYMGRSEELPSYGMVHFNISKNITDAVKVTASVENLGNMRLAEKSGDFGFSERGRLFFINLSTKF